MPFLGNDTGIVKMVQMPSGATRSSAEGKLNIMGTFSPAVLTRVAQHMAENRKASPNDRDEGDWKKGIPTDRYLDSLLRHVLSVWGYFEGPVANKEALERELCSVIFNAQGMLDNLLKSEGAGSAKSEAPAVVTSPFPPQHTPPEWRLAGRTLDAELI